MPETSTQVGINFRKGKVIFCTVFVSAYLSADHHASFYFIVGRKESSSVLEGEKFSLVFVLFNNLRTVSVDRDFLLLYHL